MALIFKLEVRFVHYYLEINSPPLTVLDNVNRNLLLKYNVEIIRVTLTRLLEKEEMCKNYVAIN